MEKICVYLFVNLSKKSGKDTGLLKEMINAIIFNN
jgi:hypothetical protein